jgi:hypothetical protein
MRAVETIPAALLNVGEELTLVGRAQRKIIQPLSLRRDNEHDWRDLPKTGQLRPSRVKYYEVRNTECVIARPDPISLPNPDNS